MIHKTCCSILIFLWDTYPDACVEQAKKEENKMSLYSHKAYNVSVLLCHYFKYRKVVLDSQRVVEVLIETCKEISVQYEIHFIEIGENMNHVHFLIQSVPIFIQPTHFMIYILAVKL